MKIGIRIDNFVPGTEMRTAKTYTEIREMAQAAESGKLDSIWLSDHLLFRFDPNVTIGPWECWTLLSALAETTNNIELGTMVLCTPFRNPALLAKMAHTLDEISGGRLILGIGAGWHQPEFDAFGYPFDHRVDQFEEALQILLPLLKGQTVDFAGTYHQAHNCEIIPLGPRTNGIPLLIGTLGPRMLRLTARYADMWNTAWLGKVEGFTERLALLQEACAEVGRDPDTLDVTANVSIAFPEFGETNSFAKEPLSGSIESLAEEFKRYAEAGTTHLIVQHTPSSLPALERLTEAVHFYRKLAR